MKGVPTTKINAHELLELLQSLGAPAVITKNKDPDAEKNYRRAQWPWSILDGKWEGQPNKVVAGEAFAIHLVERKRLVFVGEYGGAVAEKRIPGAFSLRVDYPQCFEVVDLSLEHPDQVDLRHILKKPGAVTYSYYFPASGVPTGSPPDNLPAFRMAEAKQRLRQQAFRCAVFAHHGPRCIVSGCAVPALLDAAHLMGRSWENGDNSHLDGIPLRTDLHRAYDSGLIRLDEKFRLEYVDASLLDQYGQYLQR